MAAAGPTRLAGTPPRKRKVFSQTRKQRTPKESGRRVRMPLGRRPRRRPAAGASSLISPQGHPPPAFHLSRYSKAQKRRVRLFGQPAIRSARPAGLRDEIKGAAFAVRTRKSVGRGTRVSE